MNLYANRLDGRRLDAGRLRLKTGTLGERSALWMRKARLVGYKYPQGAERFDLDFTEVRMPVYGSVCECMVVYAMCVVY